MRGLFFVLSILLLSFISLFPPSFLPPSLSFGLWLLSYPSSLGLLPSLFSSPTHSTLTFITYTPCISTLTSCLSASPSFIFSLHFFHLLYLYISVSPFHLLFPQLSSISFFHFIIYFSHNFSLFINLLS